MNVLVFSQYYYPEQFLINDVCETLVENGHKVTVITGMPNYPYGKIYSDYINFIGDREIINGVEVIRCNVRPRKNGIINLLLNYYSYMNKASRKVKSISSDYDVVFNYQLSPLTQAIPAILYKKKNKKGLVIYCLDVYPRSGSDYTKRIPFTYSCIKYLSKKIYNAADKVAVSSEPFIPYLHDEVGIPNEKLTYIPQHSDASLLNADLSSEDNGIVDFMFAGNVGKGQRLDILADAVKLLENEKDFLVHIVGDGSYLYDLKHKVNAFGINDLFRFHGYHKRSEMIPFYKMADVLYISLRKENLTLPGKFQTYLSAGKPIIGAIDGAACKIIDELQCGLYAPAEDTQALAAVMKRYINHTAPTVDSEKMKAYFIDNFTLLKFTDQLLKLLGEAALGQ